MYYLFIRNKNKLEKYKKQLNCVCENIEKGKTPVFNEMRSAKTDLIECIPFNSINALFLILATVIFDKIEINELFKIAILLITNSVSRSVAVYVFVGLKHSLRINLCKRLEIEPTEKTIAAMESMEYQSV
ncbi:MAG: hypothetical protein P1P65_00720 [Treponema sp.]